MTAPILGDPPVSYYDLDDTTALRNNIFDKVQNAVTTRFPVENATHRIEVANLKYGPSSFTKKQQKDALLKRGDLTVPLKGEWRLIDIATGGVLDSRKTTLANVPYLTERGTFIRGGNEYSLASQSRLKSGVYNRRKLSGEPESHFNVLEGGRPFHVYLNPDTSQFEMSVGAAKMKLGPVLRGMGVDERMMQEAWGDELFKANNISDDSYKKALQRFRGASESDDLREIWANSKLDPGVTESTLGEAFDHVSPEAVLAATRQIIRIARGDAEENDRDSIEFQQIMGPDDLIAERILQDKAGIIRRGLLWRATGKNELKVGAGLLNKLMDPVFTTSGLAQPLEETNLIENIDQMYKVLRTGEGGISSDGVPMESRNVQTTHLGFIDPVKGPESGAIGLDNRLTIGVKRGSDGNLYSMFRNKEGEVVPVSAQVAARSVIAFPGEMASDSERVRARVGSKIKYIDRNLVDYELPHPTNMFTVGSNLAPMMSGTLGPRLLMAGKYYNQALPLDNAEAPLVQALTEDGETTFEHLYGTKTGNITSELAGRVTSVTDDTITVDTVDGKKEYDLYKDFPLNRRSFIDNIPLVKPGDQVKPGQLIARTNLTDEQGDVALGKNLRVAYMPWKGVNVDDAIVISESAAKKMSSEHMFSKKVDTETHQVRGLKEYMGMYPGKYTKDQLAKIGEDGIIKPGTIVDKGDPLILAVKERSVGDIHRGHKPGFIDAAETWEKEAPGIITDVENTPKGVRMSIKAYQPMIVGDKLCYDSETEVLTNAGWLLFKDLTLGHKVATLLDGQKFDYIHPDSLVNYDYTGDMYRLESQQLSFCVTPEHNQYVCNRDSDTFELTAAKDVYGKRISYKKDGEWVGNNPDYFVFPELEVKAGQSGNGTRILPEIRMEIDTYMTLLGAFLSEGNIINNPRGGTYGISITQIKQPNRSKFIAALDAAGIHYIDAERQGKINILGKQLMLHFAQFGKCYQKYIPEHVYSYSKAALSTLFKWLMWGDGHTKHGKPINYTTTSKQLADDFQRLCLHIGYAGNIIHRDPEGGLIRGKWCAFRRCYVVRIVTKKLTPTINHGHVKTQKAQSESWEQYNGKVWCCAMPTGHVIYVRRNGKPAWSGNCGRAGDKGVVGGIIPDDEMPTDKDGNPMEVLLSPMTVITRTNVSQILEAMLGKIAHKTGKVQKVPGFMKESMVEYVAQKLKEADIKDTDTLIDPSTGRELKDIMTGYRFQMKAHHTAEDKEDARSIGGYTSEGTPIRGGHGGGKQLGLMEINSLISHGATDILRDAKTVRGQKNTDYWRAYQQGFTPPSPEVPLVYKKFEALMTGAGINMHKTGTHNQLLALTDKNVLEMSSGEITTPRGVDAATLNEVPNGLFDKRITGGHAGNRWGHIKLNTPLPNPIMEEPIRRLLGLTEVKFNDVIAGTEKLNERTGGEAILESLKRLDIKSIKQRNMEYLRTGKTSDRNNAVKLLRYVDMMEKNDMQPEDFMLNNIPVLPPVYRPISATDKFTIIADANKLYVDTMKNNNAYKEVADELGVDHAGEERLNLYNSYKAVTGLTDTQNPQFKSQKTGGLLKQVFGTSPKLGLYQRKVIGGAMDATGRGVLTPNPDLDMDSIGLPENMAWDLYKPHIMRRMAKRGTPPTTAVKHILERSDVARDALIEEMAERPLLINRAPSLHKYNIVALFPQITKGHTLQIPPVIAGGMNADYDGDTAQIHVPISEKAVLQAKERMLPSSNLLALKDHKVHYTPFQEFQHGLWLASSKKSSKPPRTFVSKEAAMKAYKSGELNVDDEIRIIGVDNEEKK